MRRYARKASLDRLRRAVVDGGVFSGRDERWCPGPDFQRRIEIDVPRVRQCGIRSAQPTIRGESSAEHRAGDREAGEQREPDEHDQHADAHDADGDRGRGETILDCK